MPYIYFLTTLFIFMPSYIVHHWPTINHHYNYDNDANVILVPLNHMSHPEMLNTTIFVV